MMFESLDFLYVPAPNIQESINYYTMILDGELLWKIHAYGVWVACIKLSDKEPYVLLADHVEKKDMMLIYRVNNLDKAASELRSRGWREEKSLELPNCPCKTFRDPAANAIVIYENRRPHVMEEFKGRIDNY
ncbi:MAG TPA: VOC family protein [Candidatus Nitrosopolaris sp.]|nr:VOC family protein [Candidatus Nitrosopolaris sp.]